MKPAPGLGWRGVEMAFKGGQNDGLKVDKMTVKSFKGRQNDGQILEKVDKMTVKSGHYKKIPP